MSSLTLLDRTTLEQAILAAGEENERLRQENATLRGQVGVLERDLGVARAGAKELRAELARRDARDAKAKTPAPAAPAPAAAAPPPRFSLLEVDAEAPCPR